MSRVNERGQSLVLLAASLTAMLGFLALTVDVGRWYVARQKAVNVCDMAALGAAMELSNATSSAGRAQNAVFAVVDANAAADTVVNVSHTAGPGNPDVIISWYNDSVSLNPSLTANVVWTDSTGRVIPRPAPNRGLIVRGQVPVSPVFGRVLGDGTTRDIRALTTVVLGEASQYIGTMLPFGVSKDHIANLEASPSATVEQVLTYRTWQESWGSAPGAFGTLGPGQEAGAASASDLEFNITWGYADTFRIGQAVYTTNGNMTGAIRSGLTARIARSQYAAISDWMVAFNSTDPVIHAQAMDDPRVVMFPIIDLQTVAYNGAGTVQTVAIAGFATYVISAWSPGGQQVLGYFIKSAYEGSIGATGVNYGSLAYHLL